MASKRKNYIANQVFVGLPWKNVRPKYDRTIVKLEKKFPLHFTIVGRDDGQDAQDLFEIIKQRISSSSMAVFDATGGNANVSLEYGYAEGIEVPRSLFLSSHKAAQRSSSSPIISDLGGRRRIQYKTEQRLSQELHKLCREHNYTVRFEKALTTLFQRKSGGQKRRFRSLAIKVIRQLDGKPKIRRLDLIQNLQAENYTKAEVEQVLKKFHKAGVLNCTQGKYSDVRIA